MTYGQLALLRHVIEQVKEGKTILVSNTEKVDLDYLGNYFDNLLLNIEKEKKRNSKVIYQNFILGIEVNK